MKSPPGFEDFREANWRRKLTPEEKAQVRALLAAHPEAEADWQSEAVLGEALRRLPSAPMPSNFTARVLAEVGREAKASEASKRRGWSLFHWRLRWLPRTAAAILVAGAGLLIYQHDVTARRTARAEDLRRVSEMASPDVLADFDAIHAMSQSTSADEELIRLLQ